MLRLRELPLSRVEILNGPTPIEQVDDDLWVKREDTAGTVYGGNKVRKLEYLLGEALEIGGDILTMGAVGSHHVLATAVYGKQVGVRVHGLLFPQPDSPHVRENARAIHAWCEQVWVARRRSEIPLVWAKGRLALGPFGGFPPISIPAGGSNALGCIGWIGGGLEIAAQIEAGELPCPDRVVVPLGSGGTAAGLLLGLRFAGLRTEVVAVRVVPALVTPPIRVGLLVRRTLSRLRRFGVPGVDPGELRVVGRQLGRGYGWTTPAADAAMVRARGWGLALEHAYSAKALAEVLADRVGTTLFIDTVSSKPMAPLLTTALDEVPQTLRPLLL